MQSLADQQLNLEQYKYRRRYPYNDTIKEESAESLSEMHSLLTAKSRKQFIFSDVSPKTGHWKKLSMGDRDPQKAFYALTPRNRQVDNYTLMKSKTLVSGDPPEQSQINLVSHFRKKKDADDSRRVIRSFDNLPFEVSPMCRIVPFEYCSIDRGISE